MFGQWTTVHKSHSSGCQEYLLYKIVKDSRLLNHGQWVQDSIVARHYE